MGKSIRHKSINPDSFCIRSECRNVSKIIVREFCSRAFDEQNYPLFLKSNIGLGKFER